MKNSFYHEFWLRDASMKDIEDIVELGLLLNTINLPANKSELEAVIASSEKSFAGEEPDSSKRAFLFVLVNAENRVVGTSQIFAKHGTLQFPHMYFQVGIDERYSDTLGKYFRHKTLRLMQNFNGPTEIGSLVLTKKYRSHPAKLGRSLSYVRFLFIAMNRHFFSDLIIAELLPPLGPNFESAFWNAIGRKFTDLDYYEADIISRKNKEFIQTLFPAVDIYVSLLPKEAQEIIGQVGANSTGAAHLLSSIGFRYSNRIDPFDGGPHFEAFQDNISLLKNALHGTENTVLKRESNELGIIGYYRAEAPSGQRFKAMVSPFAFDKSLRILGLTEQSFRFLELEARTETTAIPLP